MADGEELDMYGGRLAAMAARYANLGETLGDTELVKKLLDTVPDRLFPVVAGIEQFHDVTMMAFDEALGRLRAFDERVRRRGQDGGERGGDQLLLTMAQWRARERRQGVAHDDDDGRSVASGNGGNQRGRCYKCGERGHFKRDCP
uniref:CCHC-type domain-containing protein n=1 Tax=Aegilops tauschii subsp. strangulata TaxID=200361 RepID=A0A453I2F1_AEGTS